MTKEQAEDKENSGVVYVEYKPTDTLVTVGAKKARLGIFSAAADVNDSQIIYEITITQKGTADDSEINNFSIVRAADGQVMAPVTQMCMGVAKLSFSPPFTILPGDKIHFCIIGDVFGGGGKNVELNVKLLAVAPTTGFGDQGKLVASMQKVTGTPTKVLISPAKIDPRQWLNTINTHL